MGTARKRRILIILFVLSVLAIASALVLYALRQNISLFYTPTQIASGQSPLNRPVRVGGMVVEKSIVRAPKGLRVVFQLTDFEKTISVTYEGILPDLFREGQGIVAEGEARDTTHFVATRVLAKHDANYMPPEVRSILAQKVKK